MRIVFADGCAWRAFYIYRKATIRPGDRGEALVFSLGINPSVSTSRAQIFGALGFRKACTGHRIGTWNFRFDLPRSRYWWHLDGRYGTLRRRRASS